MKDPVKVIEEIKVNTKSLVEEIKALLEYLKAKHKQ